MNFFLNTFILVIFGILPNASFVAENWQFNYPKLLIIYGSCLVIIFYFKRIVFDITLSKILIGIWFLFTLISLFFSKSLLSSVFGDWYGPTREGVLMVFSSVVFYLYFSTIPLKYLQRILFTLTIGVCYGLAWGFINQSGQGFYQGIPIRMASLETHTIYFANLISLGLPSSLSLLFLQRGNRFRALSILAVMMISLGIVLSLTRAVWITSALILSIIALTLKLKGWHKKLPIKQLSLVLVLPLIAVVFYLKPLILNRINETFFTPTIYNSLHIRLIEYKTVLRMIKDYPLGIGADALRFAYPQYRSLELNKNDKEWWSVTTFIKSYYLQQAVTIGLLGTLSLILFVLVTIVRSIQYIKKSSAVQFIPMAGIFWVWLIMALNFIFYDASISLQVIFWSLSGILASVLREPTVYKVNLALSAGLTAWPARAALLSMGAVLSMAVLGIDMLSRFYFEKAVFESHRPKRLETLYKAISLNPLNNNYRFVFISDYLNQIEEGVNFRKEEFEQINSWIENAQKVLDGAKKIDPYDPQLAYKQGLLSLLKLRLTAGQEKWSFYRSALEAARFAHQLNPTNPQVLDLTTLVYLEMDGQKLKEAEAAALQTIELKPNLPGGYHHLGEALKQQGRFEEAIQAYQQTFKYDPGNQVSKKEIEKIKSLTIQSPQSPL